MRRQAIAVAACVAALAAGAAGAAGPTVVVVARPAFPPPLDRVAPSGPVRLAHVTTVARAPTYTPRRDVAVPPSAPRRLAGLEPSRAFAQPGTTFVVYGETLIAALGPRGRVRYALDLRSLALPPPSLAPSAWGQAVTWARQVDGTLVVETAHPGYARDSGGRNGYLTAIDVTTGRVLWRSPSLVANAGTFVVVRGLIVSGYGFTAERDWLYLVDLRTGTVRDRLALPSAAEEITRRGDVLVVRAYDARVVVRLAGG